MSVRARVGFTLLAIGITVLLASAIFKPPLFFPVFGFMALWVGAYKVIINQ